MMHRCGGSQGNVVGPCSCDVLQPNPSSFSMLFSKPYDHDHDHHHHDYYHDHDSDVYSYSSPGVDCTLSLGTPSTRLSTVDHVDHHHHQDHRRVRNDKRRSNFCWDLLQPKHYSSSTPQTTSSHKNATRHNNNNNNGYNNNDPLVARRCANCDTTSTPLWRNGPRGPKSLCNACGIRFKKEERRASAAAAAPATAAMDQPSHVFSHYHQYHNNNSNWNNFPNYPQPQKNITNCNEFRFIDNDEAGDTGISFLSWRLNVTDRPSLVHDFTR